MLAAPTLGAISDVTFFSGSPVHIPLNGADADDDSLSFSVISSNPSLITDIPDGNRSLRVTVLQGDAMTPTISGEMTFELFEDKASRATNRVITLANSGFYNGSTFHRVINNFVIQGGDPNGNPPGTGGSSLGTFDDQFDVDLQHNSTGLLSYAKSTDDTNDSQFFVTEFIGGTGSETSLRNLDSNHTIFGAQTTGESIRAAISDVATTNNAPNVDVVMTAVEIFVDDKNGILRINAPEGSTGSATVTVTVSDGVETAQQVFNVSFSPDTHNGAPFLADIPRIRTLADSPTTFQLTAIDAENAPNAAFLDEVELANRSLFIPQVSNSAELLYDIGFLSGAVIVQPQNAFAGTSSITVSTGEFTTAIDYQVVPIEIVAAASPWSVSSADHPGLTEANDGAADEIRVVRNGSKFEVFVNGQATAQAEDLSVTTLTIDGSRDDDTLIIDYSGGNPFPTGGIIFNGHTVDPLEVNPPADTGQDSLEFIGSSVPAATFTFTSATDGTVSLNSDVLTFTGLETDPLVVSTADHPGMTAANDGSADVIRLARNGSNLEVSVNGTLTSVTADDAISALTINGSRDDDTLVVDYSGGNPFPFGQLTFNGYAIDPLEMSPPPDTGFDSLILINGTVDEVSYEFLTASDGSVRLDTSLLVFSGLEPIEDNLNVTDRVFTYSSADDVISLGDDGIASNGISRIATTGTAELVDFTTPSGSLTVDAGAGADSLTVANLDTGPFAVTALGGAGDDTLSGSSLDDVMDGGGDNDILIGGNGNDSITGGSGNDSLFGGNGADILDGGEGDDVLRGQATGGDILTGGPGSDFIDGGSGVDQLIETLDDAMLTLTDNSLTGTDSDVLTSIESAMITLGASSNNFNGSGFSSAMTIRGGSGDDTLFGGPAADLIEGEDGADSILGFNGDDTITGGAGNDTLLGSSGSDMIDGGADDDDIRGQGSSNDSLTGGLGNDTLNGGSGTDRVLESADVDWTLTPGQLTGLGTDVLISIEQADLSGGDGNNTLDARTFTSVLTSVSLRGGLGDDTLLGSPGNDGVYGDFGDDVMHGFGGNDDMYGGAGSDLVDGGDGNDFVRGQGTSGDSVSGGPGDDTIDGGTGTDFLVVNADVASLVIARFAMVGNGTDILRGLERLDVTGGPGNNMIDARAFDANSTSIIRGFGGDDEIFGTVTADQILGGDGNDTIHSNAGADTVLGEAGDDTIEGEADDDDLRGGDDNDNILGGAGNDLITGEAGDDTLGGGDGNDTLQGGAGNDNLDGGDGNDGLSGAAGADFLLGNAGDDIMYGGSGNDTLLGSGGGDIVVGGGGDDQITGNGATDILVGGIGNGMADAGDVFTDAQPGEIDENFMQDPLPSWVEEV